MYSKGDAFDPKDHSAGVLGRETMKRPPNASSIVQSMQYHQNANAENRTKRGKARAARERSMVERMHYKITERREIRGDRIRSLRSVVAR